MLWLAPPSLLWKPRPGETLWSPRRDGLTRESELRCAGEYGVEAQILRYGEQVIGRRFDTRALAVQWADEERKVMESNTFDTTKNFEQVANRPEAWQSTSRDLWVAAEILKREHDAADEAAQVLKAGDDLPPALAVRPTEMMLRGFALENLLKAWWVKQGNAIVQNGRYVGIPGVGNHQLAELAAAVGLVVDASRRNMLDRLTQFMMSVGRYPIPTRAEHGPGVWWSTPQDDDILNEIIHELQARLA